MKKRRESEGEVSVADTPFVSLQAQEATQDAKAGTGKGKGKEKQRATGGPKDKVDWKFGKKGKRERRGEWAPRPAVLEDDGSSAEKKERLAKRKCVVLLGFCGAGYSGMQIQRDHSNTKTIEGTLFDAFVKAGAVSKDNSDDPTKVSLSRAARTDSGVHAARNAVSLKMILDIPTLTASGIDLVPHLNSLLPPEIRVWDIIRTTNNFNSCDSRVYEYLFPSYVLLPPPPGSGLATTLLRVNTKNKALRISPPPSNPSTSAPFPSDPVEQTLISYRATPGDLARLQALVKAFQGTHNFHNYTVAREFGDRSAQRYMVQVDVRDPQVYDGIEWISVLFHGQSFMLHQRKMIGLVMLAARTHTPPELIPETYGPSKIHIPKAPALGLLLEEPRFGVYNLKVADTNAELALKSAQGAQKIDYEKHCDTIDAFKRDMIYTRMRQEEAEHRVFARWLSFVDSYPGADFEYLNHKGVIPPSAILQKGARYENQFKEFVKMGNDSAVIGLEDDGDGEGLDVKSAEMDG
ncbi:hypothetical protein BS47DRAFT_1293494 [Hydnum rufescens UP504]|uniref:Pseudouridine synthase I TruA alpha/beta domain-containing protein n=1 Tax=Hydnum rufescens UP504 TaxID=1448309 RepID=A0A9P6B1I5_9AGAM|nr:hypothetical protein BS47DRAFT_1293494 [Hydnum rufescens UP504]